VDIAAWLSSLGLRQYARSFGENDVDPDVLLELTVDDLLELGVRSVGHRRKLLAGIAALRRETENSGKVDALPPEENVRWTPPSMAERRQLTVMFCDLVGSTALSARLDPEDMRDVVNTYYGAVTKIIVEAGGFVSRYMGDGVLAYFGYPQAHEDDAERAIRAGLAITDAVPCLNVQLVELQARVGIATGLVVVGDVIGEGSAQEELVVGETPNLAARMQALAEPNTVVIAAGTRRLVGALFEYHDLGAVNVKGIPRAVSAWQVLRSGVVASRFEALRGMTLTKLVGRDEEIDLMLRRWDRAKAGDGQVILVSGEAGLGKSRIAETLNERLNAEAATRVRYYCSPYHQDSALFPFVDQLSRSAGFARDDLPAIRRKKLETLIAPIAPPEEDVALLADLLSLPAREQQHLSDLSPERKKQRTLEALVRQLEGLASKQPTLIIFEDAHWIDPTSRELLDLAIERVRGLPILLVITFRPEFQAPWTGQPRVSVLALNRLDRGDRAALVQQVAAGKAMPEEVVDQIVDRTDGVPLFVEELTKTVLESDLLREEDDRFVLDRALPPFAIPTSLHDSLMARLDRSEAVRHVAQIGAAIGREFSFSLLQTVSRLPQQELQLALDRLVASELVFQRGVPPDAVYTFKHTLVQDAAHSSLLRSARQRLHAQIAEALESHFPELMDSQPELFALHYSEAGMIEKAVDYWGRAGRRSIARSAMAEAAAQLRKGLDQLALLPDSAERRRQELEFYSALGATLRYVKGHAAPEVGDVFARARQLWEELGSPSDFLHVPYGQARYHMYRGEFETVLKLDEHLLRLSNERNDSAGLVLGHDSSGRDLCLAGKFAAARAHLEQVLALYDPSMHSSLVRQTGVHPRVVAQGHLGIALFCLGFPDQAMARSQAAIDEARTLEHPPSLAASLAQNLRLLSCTADDAKLNHRAEELLFLATEQGYPLYRFVATIYRGWAKVKTGGVTEGISLLRSGAGAYRTIGAEARTPYHIGLLARACALAGQSEEALSLLDDALRLTERIGEGWFVAELYRHKGEFALRQGQASDAAACYSEALALARKQGARLWELRATVSLARLRRDQGDHAKAHELLEPAFRWFTEGFDTPDLTVAKALLNERHRRPTKHTSRPFLIL